MEVIGLVASLATLTKIARSAADLASRLSGASSDLESVKAGVQHISTSLQLLQTLPIECLCKGGLCSEDDILRIKETVNRAEQSITQVENSVTRLATGTGKSLRVKWALKRGAEAQRLLEHLARAEKSLNLTLSILLCHSAVRDHSVLRHIDQELCLVSQGWDLVRKELLPKSVKPSATDLEAVDDAPPVRSVRSWKYASEDVTSGHGIAAVLTSTKDRRQATHVLSAQLGLPFALTLVVNLLVRTYARSWLTVSMLRGSTLSIVNFVHRDSDFMKASEKGDVLTMRHLLDKGLAGVNDVTTGNITPISLAIDSGSVEAVGLLIGYGAEVDGLFGQLQTSPLAWALCRRKIDIVRLLLSYGASCQHITSLGWSPLFYLWHGANASPTSAEDFLVLLASRPDFRLSHFEVADTEGFGVIHRAVIFGTSEDVASLILFGVSPFSTVGPLHWTPIQSAVYYDRMETFEVLLPLYQHFSIDEPDLRGWTLLHISASVGNNRITKRLLQLGADFSAVSKPSYTHMPEEIYGGRWTPAEVAKACGDDKWLDFLAIVREVKGDSALTSEELRALKEDWHDALEFNDV